MNPNGYSQGVARTQKALHPVDERIAAILADLVKDADIRRRDLAQMTGMSANRLGIILRQESPPATVGEIGAIARALGTTASVIIGTAEVSVGDPSNTGGQQDYALAARKRSKDRGEGVID